MATEQAVRLRPESGPGVYFVLRRFLFVEQKKLFKKLVIEVNI